MAAFLVGVGESSHEARRISTRISTVSRPTVCSVYNVPAECCRVDGADGKCRIDINTVVENSISKKSSGLDCVREKTPYLPGVNLWRDC